MNLVGETTPIIVLDTIYFFPTGILNILLMIHIFIYCFLPSFQPTEEGQEVMTLDIHNSTTHQFHQLPPEKVSPKTAAEMSFFQNGECNIYVQLSCSIFLLCFPNIASTSHPVNLSLNQILLWRHRNCRRCSAIWKPQENQI